MSEEDAPVYLAVGSTDRLFQGEILSGVVERQAVRQQDGTFDLGEIEHPFVLIVSQDCDLEQDARARADARIDSAKKQNAQLPHVLLAVASDFANASGNFAGSDVRKRARLNKDERFHFLGAIVDSDDALGEGIAPLIVDFKRLFSYPTAELLASIAAGEAKRRARLAPQYLEHLSSRTGYFLLRVALPRDHHDLPEDVRTVRAAVALPPAAIHADDETNVEEPDRSTGNPETTVRGAPTKDAQGEQIDPGSTKREPDPPAQ